MNGSTVLRLVVAMHDRYRQNPERWRTIRASTSRGRRLRTGRALCGLPDLCAICRKLSGAGEAA